VGQGGNGARCQWRGVGRRGVREAVRRRGTDRRAWLAQCEAARFKLGFKLIKKYSNGSNEI
jgi:hypothetical protein